MAAAARAGHTVIFATEQGGHVPRAIRGCSTGVLFGQLGAEPEPGFYAEISGLRPSPPSRLRLARLQPAFDALLLPGGHAPACASTSARRGAAGEGRRVLGAGSTGRRHLPRRAGAGPDPPTRNRPSLLGGRRTTCLPKYMERARTSTAWKLGRYYRTYPAYVEDEVRAALAARPRSSSGAPTLSEPRHRDHRRPRLRGGGRPYLSARWPGDAYLFAKRFGQLLQSRPPASQ